MRRFLSLAALAAAAWWLIGRQRSTPAVGRVTIGYADGSSVTLDAGSPELERLAAIAVEAAAQ